MHAYLLIFLNVCVFVPVFMHVYACVDMRLMFSFFFYCSYHTFEKKGRSLNLELTDLPRQAGQQNQGSFGLCLLRAGSTSMHYHEQCSCRCKGLNSGCSCLHDKCFTKWATSPVPNIYWFKNVQNIIVYTCKTKLDI